MKDACSFSVGKLIINNTGVAGQKTRRGVGKEKIFLLGLRDGVLTVEYEIPDVAKAGTGGPAGSR